MKKLGMGTGLSGLSGLSTLAGGFKGLLDTYTVTAAYSTRQLRADQTVAIRLRRDSDNAESDFGFSGHELDQSTIATWLGGANGYVKTWYDQSGNGLDVSQTTTGNQPLYVAAGQNGKAVISFSASKYLNRAAVTLSSLVATNIGIVYLAMLQNGAVAQHTNIDIDAPNTSNRLNINATFNNVIYFDFGNTAGGGRINVAQPAGWDDAFHICEFYRNTTAGEIVVDGSTILSDTFSDDLDVTQTSTWYVGGAAAANFVGYLGEIIVMNSVPASRGAVRSSISDFFIP